MEQSLLLLLLVASRGQHDGAPAEPSCCMWWRLHHWQRNTHQKRWHEHCWQHSWCLSLRLLHNLGVLRLLLCTASRCVLWAQGTPIATLRAGLPVLLCAVPRAFCAALALPELAGLLQQLQLLRGHGVHRGAAEASLAQQDVPCISSIRTACWGSVHMMVA